MNASTRDWLREMALHCKELVSTDKRGHHRTIPSDEVLDFLDNLERIPEHLDRMERIIERLEALTNREDVPMMD